MSNLKVLITGSSGKLGEALANIISSETDYQLVLLSSNLSFNPDIASATVHKCNVLDFKKVKTICYDEKPDYIINCASVNDLLFCEYNRKICSDVNVMVYDNILSVCRVIDSHLIMPSCDYIFNGKYGPYSEEKRPEPINYLGKSKHAAENNCRAGTINLSLVRTSLLYGKSSYNNHGFINETINKLSNNEKIYVPNKFYFTPTFTDDAARVITKLIEKKRNGIYHASSKEMLSLYKIAKKIADVYDFDHDLIHKIPADDFNMKSIMPAKAGLISLKAETDLNIKFLSFEEGLSVMKYKNRRKKDN